MQEFDRRKKEIARAIRQLAEDGYMAESDVEPSIEALDDMSATEVATTYRLFVTENR